MSKIITYNNRLIKTNPYILQPDTNGLVLFLDADNPASYSGSGLSWFDISPEGNNCLLDATNPPLFQDGLFKFVASKQNKALVPNHSSLNFGTGDFTILHYSEHPIIGSDIGSVLSKGSRFDVPRAGWLITAHAGAALYQVISDGTQQLEMWFPFATTSTFSRGFYGLMRRGGLLYCVYNGVALTYVPTNGSQSTDQVMNIDSSDDISIGCNAIYNSYWNGNINKIIVYNRGISDSELNILSENSQRFATYKIIKY